MRPGDISRDCRCRDDFRTREITLGIARSHAALEVAVRGGDSDLTFFQQSHAEADARSASGRQRVRTCVEQRLPDTKPLRLLLHPGACRSQVELHARRDSLTAHDPSCGFQIFQPRICARNQVGLLNGYLLLFYGGKGLHHLHGVGPGDMGSYLSEVERNACRIESIRIGVRRIRSPTVNAFQREALDALLLQAPVYAAQILNRKLVHREPCHQRSPLGAHVRDGESCIHRQTGHARPHELNRSVECLVVVEEAAQGDDHVFAADTLTQLALQHNLDGPRNLPPEFARGPHRSRIGAYDGRSNGAERSVHIRVRIGGDDKRSRHNITALHHDLVADARTCGIEIDSVFFGKGLDRAVFLQVDLILILDVVIEGKDKLFGLANLFRADCFELTHNG